jgi:transcriptional regulator with XRE-family HTH domain
VNPEDLANAIKELRGKRRQREVAERAQIDPATWSAYEQGTRFPRRHDRFEDIARGLGVSELVLSETMFRYTRKRLGVTTDNRTPPDDSELEAFGSRYTEVMEEFKEFMLRCLRGRGLR